jgi:hypothetical protein
MLQNRMVIMLYLYAHLLNKLGHFAVVIKVAVYLTDIGRYKANSLTDRDTESA